MSEDLKPCPFCGERAFLHDTNSIQGFSQAHVECGSCSVSVQGEDGSSGEAIAAWNRRARPSPTGEKVEAVDRIIRNMQGIADALKRADGSDIPLGEQCREAASTLTALVAERDEARKRADAAEADTTQWEARATIAETALSTANARVEGLETELTWYGSLPKEWTINAGAGATYGDLYMLGERARAALTGGENGR